MIAVFFCSFVMESAVLLYGCISDRLGRLAVHNERSEGRITHQEAADKETTIGHRDAQLQERARLKNELRKSLGRG